MVYALVDTIRVLIGREFGQECEQLMNWAHALGEFHRRLIHQFRAMPLPPVIENERDLDLKLIIAAAEKSRTDLEGIEVCVHPWNNPECCADKHRGTRTELGCPKCWADSKRWASVDIWGTQHSFDLAARGANESLVVEAKVISFEDHQPNGELQRFFGQCLLARSIHRHVIGLCVYHGQPQSEHGANTNHVLKYLDALDIDIVFRPAVRAASKIWPS